MTNPKSRIFAAVVGALSVSATAAWADNATQAQDSKIQELEAKVAALESKQVQNQKDVAATIDAVLRDAERRSQLLATTGDNAAGYDNGFFIRQGSAYQLRPGAQFQFRNVTDYRSDTAGPKDDEIENGFELRRVKFELTGTVLTPDLTFALAWATSRTTGSLILEDAWVAWMFADDWGLRAGQFKDPGNGHEELTSSKRQLAVDRSLANEILNGGVLDRVQGVTLIYGGRAKNNPINAEVGLIDGLNTDNSDYTKVGALGADFGVAGRIEGLLNGDWRDYNDFTAKGTKSDLLVLGAGGDFTQFGNSNVYHGSVDAQWENTGGLGLFAALYVQHVEPGDGLPDATNWGAVLQAGYLLNDAWEIFGRYAYIDIDDADELHEFTFGFNYYLGKNGDAMHRAKITVDVNFLPEGAGGGDTGLGYLGDNGSEDEISVRGQFQLLI